MELWAGVVIGKSTGGQRGDRGLLVYGGRFETSSKEPLVTAVLSWVMGVGLGKMANEIFCQSTQKRRDDGTAAN